MINASETPPPSVGSCVSRRCARLSSDVMACGLGLVDHASADCGRDGLPPLAPAPLTPQAERGRSPVAAPPPKTAALAGRGPKADEGRVEPRWLLGLAVATTAIAQAALLRPAEAHR